jgi:hypothetical protein
MKNLLLILFALVICSCGNKSENKGAQNQPATVQQKIIDDPNFVIELKKEYINPDYNKEQMMQPVNPGPHNGQSYIADPSIKTLKDLSTLFVLQSGLRFAVLEHSNGAKQPVIVNTNNQVYSFHLEEEGILTYDTKVIYDEAGQKKVKFETVEVEKKK